MDRTLLELLGLCLAGVGTFAALTEYDAPELYVTYFDQNTFAKKGDIINKFLVVLFGLVIVIGLLIQAALIILGEDIDLPKRLYSLNEYILIFILEFVFSLFVTFGVGKLARSLSRRKWFPIIVEDYRKFFERIKDVVENLDKKSPTEIESAEKRLKQLETILEIESANLNLTQRFEKIGKHFKLKSLN